LHHQNNPNPQDKFHNPTNPGADFLISSLFLLNDFFAQTKNTDKACRVLALCETGISMKHSGFILNFSFRIFTLPHGRF
jgi:hypothetical protein